MLCKRMFGQKVRRNKEKMHLFLGKLLSHKTKRLDVLAAKLTPIVWSETDCLHMHQQNITYCPATYNLVDKMQLVLDK